MRDQDREDNSIEFLKGSQRATVSFTQTRYVSRIKTLAKQRPGECRIIADNPDGRICAHIPVSWVKIAPPVIRTQAQRETARKNIQKHGRVPQKGD